ncbi:MAG TPA: hypothetical protein VL172_01665 [Kofleriaceae bacterium]|nr:hypothetical protein [Kofleriaceae bacterium]
MRDRFLPLLLATMVSALAGCPTVDLGETPPDPDTCDVDFVYYRDVIWPQYLAPADTAKSCVGASQCHRHEDGRSALRLDTNPVDDDANYQVVVRFLNCGSPDDSPLLTKPEAELDPHGGGDLFTMGDAEVQTFLMWFP